MPATSHEHADFYASPAVYDILHTPGTAREVDGLERLARRFVGPGARAFLEPACGSGRYLRVLALRGHRAIGFDRDGAMVEYASARLRRFKRARVFVGDMRTFADAGGVRAGSVDLAFTPINSIRHLDSDRAMLEHLEQVARVLRAGGRYAVGVSITQYGVEEPSEDRWEGGRGGCRVTQVVQYLPAPGGPGRGGREETVISHMTVRTTGRTRHIDSSYVLRAYDLGQWDRLVSRSALRVEAVVDERGDDLALAPPGYAVFVLGLR